MCNMEGCEVLTPDKLRAEALINMLGIKFSRRGPNGERWSEPRARTEWGTKTRRGLVACVVRIMFEDPAPCAAEVKHG